VRLVYVAELTVALTCLMVRTAFASDYTKLDGTWWNSLPSQSKTLVVQGMVSGFEGGFDNGTGAVSRYLIHKIPMTKDDLELSEDVMNLPEPSFSKTFQTYADEITDFYAKNPDLVSKIDVTTVFGCLDDGEEASCLSELANIGHRKQPSPQP
jgi:hypothetical protein